MVGFTTRGDNPPGSDTQRCACVCVHVCPQHPHLVVSEWLSIFQLLSFLPLCVIHSPAFPLLVRGHATASPYLIRVSVSGGILEPQLSKLDGRVTYSAVRVKFFFFPSSPRIAHENHMLYNKLLCLRQKPTIEITTLLLIHCGQIHQRFIKRLVFFPPPTTSSTEPSTCLVG